MRQFGHLIAAPTDRSQDQFIRRFRPAIPAQAFSKSVMRIIVVRTSCCRASSRMSPATARLRRSVSPTTASLCTNTSELIRLCADTNGILRGGRRKKNGSSKNYSRAISTHWNARGWSAVSGPTPRRATRARVSWKSDRPMFRQR